MCQLLCRRDGEEARRFPWFPDCQLNPVAHKILRGHEVVPAWHSEEGFPPDDDLEEGAEREEGCRKAFRTGDLGVITPEGLKILGRLDLQVKIGGTAPTDLEDDPAILPNEWALGGVLWEIYRAPTFEVEHALHWQV